MTAGNAGDASAAEALLSDVLPSLADAGEAQPTVKEASTLETPSTGCTEVYGDASYGTAELVEKVQAARWSPTSDRAAKDVPCELSAPCQSKVAAS